MVSVAIQTTGLSTFKKKKKPRAVRPQFVDYYFLMYHLAWIFATAFIIINERAIGVMSTAMYVNTHKRVCVAHSIKKSVSTISADHPAVTFVNFLC